MKNSNLIKLSVISLGIIGMVSCKDNATTNTVKEGEITAYEASASKSAINSDTSLSKSNSSSSTSTTNASTTTENSKRNATLTRVYTELALNEEQRIKFKTWQKWNAEQEELVHDNNAKKMIMKSEGEKRLKAILNDDQYDKYVTWTNDNPDAWNK